MRRHRHAARGIAHAGMRPQLPMHAHPLQLAVSAERDLAAGALHSGGAASHYWEMVLIRRNPRRAPAEVVEHAMRNESAQHLAAVRVGRLIEVLLGRRSAIRHQQRRRVVRARSRQQLHDVVVEFVRQRVLKGGEPVDDRRQIGHQLACPLHRQQHAFLATGVREPESLVTARLLVDLDHPRAVRLHALHLPARVVQAVDLGVERYLLAAVEHHPGREDAGAKHASCLDQLRLREDVQ